MVGLDIEPLTHPENIGLGRCALNLATPLQVRQGPEDITADPVLMGWVGHRDHPVFSMDLKVGVRRSLGQLESQRGPRSEIEVL
jgi:hypothetical protein